MSQKLIESVDINKLISVDINDFIPSEIDFEQVVAWYVFSLTSFDLQTDTNRPLADFLDHGATCWILRVKSQEDKVKLIFRRLVASVVLKINDFSSVLLEQCRKFVSGDEIKDTLKTIAQYADLFEAHRANYKNVLEKKLIISTKINNLNQSNSSGSQNLPKYWISAMSPEGWRRFIYLDKKNSNLEYTVQIGTAEYFIKSGLNAIPFFDSLKQANDFIENIKVGKSSTLNGFIFNIVEISSTKSGNIIRQQNLQDYVLVDTTYGKAYLNKNASCY